MNRYMPQDLVDEMLNAAARVEREGGHYGNALMAVIRVARQLYGLGHSRELARQFLADLGWPREQEVTR